MPTGNRRANLEDWLDNEIMPWFRDRVLPVTLPIAEHWGYLAAQSKVKGRPRPIVDAVLAATAVKHDLVLVTRNVRDYEDLGVTILNLGKLHKRPSLLGRRLPLPTVGTKANFARDVERFVCLKLTEPLYPRILLTL